MWAVEKLVLSITLFNISTVSSIIIILYPSKTHAANETVYNTDINFALDNTSRPRLLNLQYVLEIEQTNHPVHGINMAKEMAYTKKQALTHENSK